MVFESNPAAKRLLFEYLSDQQRECYLEYGHFYVLAKPSGVYHGYGGVYALGSGWQVIAIDELSGMPCRDYYCWGHCGYLSGSVQLPLEDSLLLQKLCLETCPERVFETACSNGTHNVPRRIHECHGYATFVEAHINPKERK